MDKEVKQGRKINWYRTPLDAEVLKRLNRRSNLMGFAQTLGYLGLYGLTLGAALYGWGRWHWAAIAGIVFLHGMVSAFMINGVHELGHGTVFRTKALNEFFVRVLAFLGWINYRHFNTSHLRHHAYTLHPPDDLEVVLPVRMALLTGLKNGILNIANLRGGIRESIRLARGQFRGQWEAILFPPTAPQKARPVVAWARTMLIGHTLIVAGSLAMAWFVSPRFLLVPLMVTCSRAYGSWLFFLCNSTQHVGLQDNVPDFRLNSRSFLLNPVVRLLYWQMNYHIEHHMYPTVPCYNLGRLHRAIEHDLPPCPKGLFPLWREILQILAKQRADPTYQHKPPLPLRPADLAAAAPA